MRWMKLEPTIQSEVSQKEKHQYSILTHIYGLWKDGNDNPVCETAKETQIYSMDFWTLMGRDMVGWFVRMSLKHVYYHVRNESPVYARYRIQDAWGWCPRDDQERWYGLGGEKGVQDQELMYTCGWLMSMYGKTNTVLYSKIKLKKKKPLQI